MKYLIIALLLAASPAIAGTYGRVSGGYVIDVITGPTLTAALAGRFAENYKPRPYWSTVPDTDTNAERLQSSARDNGDGTFTNPPLLPELQVSQPPMPIWLKWLVMPRDLKPPKLAHGKGISVTEGLPRPLFLIPGNSVGVNAADEVP